MRPRLDRSLVLEAPAKMPDGAGGFTTTWVPLGVLWGEIRVGAGRERAMESLTIASLSFRIFVRSAPEGAPRRPVAGQRFRTGSRLFHIEAVTEMTGNPGFLVCYATEEVAS